MAKSQVKAFVRIQSSVDINVTMGLNNQDVTNPDAHIPDRLKINPLWPKAMVLIRKGTGWYPSEIVEWNSVKSLERNKIITIGEFSDTADDENAESTKEALIKNIELVKSKETKKAGASLNSLTEE